MRSKTVRIASSHIITTCATAAAILLFVALGSRVLGGVFVGTAVPDGSSTLSAAFILNIAIILFGWRRSKDLKEALDAVLELGFRAEDELPECKELRLARVDPPLRRQRTSRGA